MLRVIVAFDVDEDRGWNIFAGAVELLAGIVIVSDCDMASRRLALLVWITFILNGIEMFALGSSLPPRRGGRWRRPERFPCRADASRPKQRSFASQGLTAMKPEADAEVESGQCVKMI